MRKEAMATEGTCSIKRAIKTASPLGSPVAMLLFISSPSPCSISLVWTGTFSKAFFTMLVTVCLKVWVRSFGPNGIVVGRQIPVTCSEMAPNPLTAVSYIAATPDPTLVARAVRCESRARRRAIAPALSTRLSTLSRNLAAWFLSKTAFSRCHTARLPSSAFERSRIMTGPGLG